MSGPERYIVRRDESCGDLGLYREVRPSKPGAASGWEKIASIENFGTIVMAIAESDYGKEL